jgi:hypothetical protein
VIWFVDSKGIAVHSAYVAGDFLHQEWPNFNEPWILMNLDDLLTGVRHPRAIAHGRLSPQYE